MTDPNEPTASATKPDPLPMPGGATAAPPSDQPAPEGQPPSFGRQVAQLVVIPFIVMLAVLGVFSLFVFLAGRQQSTDDLLERLRQSSGQGRMAIGLQDPRYKDRSLAAYNLAVALRDLTEPAEKARISTQLIDILDHSVGQDEVELQVYLLLALGQLGQDEALPTVTDYSDSSHPQVRQSVAQAIGNWPDRARAHDALDALIALCGDDESAVRTLAAVALGAVAYPEDTGAIAALKQVMDDSDAAGRVTVWNAAIALARLGDPQGSAFVADLLLDRAALQRLPDLDEDGRVVHPAMPAEGQTQVLLRTLRSAATMTDQRVWQKIGDLAARDPDISVRKYAAEAQQKRKK